MSLILDALNKSEQERSERSNPVNIHTVHAPVPDDARHRRNRRWMWEAGIAVLLLLGFYIYSQLDAPVVAPVTNVEEAAAALPSPGPTAATPALVEPARALPKPAGVAAPVTSVVQSNSAIRQLYEKPDVAPAAVKAKPGVSEKAVNTATKTPPAADKNAQWIKVPLISELSSTSRTSIPSIDFSIHVYSEQAGESVVELNGGLRKEGDRLASGLQVVKIFEHGVILDYQGTRFRLLPLSGWINM